MILLSHIERYQILIKVLHLEGRVVFLFVFLFQDQTVTSDCGSEISVTFTISKKGKTTLEDAIVSKIGMDCPCYVPPTTTTTTTKPIGKGAKCTDPLVCSSISSLKRNTKYMYIYSDKRYSLSLTMVVPGLGE